MLANPYKHDEVSSLWRANRPMKNTSLGQKQKKE